MSLEVKRNFLRYTHTVYRCVLEDEENNITICCHLSDDDNGSDLDMCIIDENGNMGDWLKSDDETYKKYVDVVNEMWNNGDIGEYGEEI